MGLREWEVTDNRKIISLGGEDNILELGIEMVTQLCEYTRNYWIIYLKKGESYGMWIIPQ